jgi:hypothetical protein
VNQTLRRFRVEAPILMKLASESSDAEIELGYIENFIGHGFRCPMFHLGI